MSFENSDRDCPLYIVSANLEYLLRRTIPEKYISIEKLPDSKINSLSKISFKCGNCRHEKTIQVASVVRVIKRTGSYQCNSCSLKQKWEDKEYVKNQRNGLLKCWNNEKKQRQSAISKKLWSNNNFREKQRQLSIDLWNDEKKRQAASIYTKSLWKNPQYMESHVLTWTDEYRFEHSNKIKQLWQNPEYRAKFERLWQDPIFKGNISMGVKKAWTSDEYKQKIIAAQKHLWKDNDHSARMAKIRSLTSGKDSVIERITQRILTQLNIGFECQFPIGPYCFDIVVPSYNLLIECQGEYWHSSDKAKQKDSSKFTYIDKYFPRYKILYLHERDFLNPGIVKQKLIRGLFDSNHLEEQIDFSFDKIAIMELDQKDKLPSSYYSAPEEFLQSFHYAGFGRSAKKIFGAYFDNQLVAVCKFASAVRQEMATSFDYSYKNVLELDRFCIHPSFHKKNFASWLISRCVKSVFSAHNHVTCLIAFADFTYGHTGSIYKATNWEELSKSQSSYYYMSPEGWIMNKKTLYRHAQVMKKTEQEYAEEFGYAKMYGKEKIKYILKR